MTFFSNYASKVHDIRNFVQKWEIEMSQGVGLPAPIIGACIVGLKAYLQVNYLAALVMITNLTAHIFVCTYIQFLLSYTSNFPVSYSNLRTSVSYNFNGYCAHCIIHASTYVCVHVHIMFMCNFVITGKNVTILGIYSRLRQQYRTVSYVHSLISAWSGSGPLVSLVRLSYICVEIY